jgi:hypothetical protein
MRPNDRYRQVLAIAQSMNTAAPLGSGLGQAQTSAHSHRDHDQEHDANRQAKDSEN